MSFDPKSLDTSSLKVALGEYDIGWHDPATSLDRASKLAREARAANADLLVLPEMCITGFTMEAETFAEPKDGPSINRMSRIAAEQRLWIVAGASMRKGEGQFVNTALVFSPDGELAASYDKQRLFGYAEETQVYSPGKTSCVVDIGGVTTGVFICFDLRFPELFRAVGRDVDAFVLIANWPATRQKHWEVLIQARAIENQCYMIAVNRIGEGGGLEYTGGSAIFDPWGERCDRVVAGSTLRIADVSKGVVERTRKVFPLQTGAAQAPTSRRAK